MVASGMKAGDEVVVFPVHQFQLRYPAKVTIISQNLRAIAVGFDEHPPFHWGDPLSLAIHPDHGIMLFASRDQAKGPWREMMSGELFEIEERHV